MDARNAWAERMGGTPSAQPNERESTAAAGAQPAQPAQPAPSPITELGRLQQRLETIEQGLARFSHWAKDSATSQGELASQVAHLQQVVDDGAEGKPLGDPLFAYRATPEQLAKLGEALAAWQAAAPVLAKGHTASFKTRDESSTIEYDYASPGDVSALARTAGAHGLSHFHHPMVSDQGAQVIRTYLMHVAGGYIWADVPLLLRENRAMSAIQLWAAAATAAKRLGLLLVLAIMPDDSDDTGEPRAPRGPDAKARSRGPVPPVKRPPPLPAENVRRVGAATDIAS